MEFENMGDRNHAAWASYADWITTQETVRVRPQRALPPPVIQALNSKRPQGVAHLMCGTGEELLSLSGEPWFHHGLGVDWAGAFIRSATARLQDETCQFVESDVRHYLAKAVDSTPFPVDCVLNTYGSLWWIPNISQYINGVAQLLDHGGWYVVSELHPVVQCLRPDGTFGDPYPIVSFERRRESGITDYILGAGHVSGRQVTYYLHSLASIVSAALRSGLRLETIEEYTTVHNEQFIPAMREERNGHFSLPGDHLPLSYLLVFVKKRA